MVDIPSFLDINDFFGTFVPGYVAITLYIVLFQPELINDPSRHLATDIFLAVVFIIAGPTLGLAIRQFQRTILFMWSTRTAEKRRAAQLFALEYAELRIHVQDGERKELDKVEATMDFAVSTGVALIITVAYHAVTINMFDWSNHLFLLVFSGILFIGAYADRKYSFGQIYYRLRTKHGINLNQGAKGSAGATPGSEATRPPSLPPSS